MATYRGDIIVGLKFIPPEAAAKHHAAVSAAAAAAASSADSRSGGSLSLRKFGSIKVGGGGGGGSGSAAGAAVSSATSIGRGSLHVLVKEGKNLQAVKANGSCDAFCKR